MGSIQNLNFLILIKDMILITSESENMRLLIWLKKLQWWKATIWGLTVQEYECSKEPNDMDDT